MKNLKEFLKTVWGIIWYSMLIAGSIAIIAWGIENISRLPK
jgi:hypothetical protein